MFELFININAAQTVRHKLVVNNNKCSEQYKKHENEVYARLNNALFSAQTKWNSTELDISLPGRLQGSVNNYCKRQLIARKNSYCLY